MYVKMENSTNGKEYLWWTILQYSKHM